AVRLFEPAADGRSRDSHGQSEGRIGLIRNRSGARRPRSAGAGGLRRRDGRVRSMRALILTATVLAGSLAHAADYPAPREADFIIHDFRFATGESLPELRIHYHAFGEPRRDAHGVVRNAVLIVHGTGGSGASLIRPEFAGELFGRGQPLD